MLESHCLEGSRPSLSLSTIRGLKPHTLFKFSSYKMGASTLSFLSLFFLEKGKENHPKNKDFYPYRTLKIPGREGKNAQKSKEFLGRGKKGIRQKQGKEGQGMNSFFFLRRAEFILRKGYFLRPSRSRFRPFKVCREGPSYGSRRYGSAFFGPNEIWPFSLELSPSSSGKIKERTRFVEC